MKLVVLAAALCALTTPAFAIDCSRAATKVEHQICDNRTLHRADDEMSAAYGKLLHSIDDPEIRAALIESQRRWIQARNSGINDPATVDDQAVDDGEAAPATWAGVLSKVTRDRMTYLTEKTAGKPAFVASALAQRKALGVSGTGSLAGFTTSCTFIPDRQHRNRYTYDCFGSMSRQNGNRLCTESNDFASYTTETTRTVVDIVDGHAHTRASCGFGYAGIKACPDDTIDGNEPDGGWDMTSHAGESDTPPGKEALKLDPESSESVDDAAWMDACLADKSFPAPANASGKKP